MCVNNERSTREGDREIRSVCVRERGRERERKQEIEERCWTLHDGRYAQIDYKKIFG